MTLTKEQALDRMVEAILTSATCGEGCWYAKEKVCRCSCGGKNHGCLLDGETERPARTSRIQGSTYQLVASGPYHEIAKQFNKMILDLGEAGYKTEPWGRFRWWHTDKGSPVRFAAAAKRQRESWDELRGATFGTYLLWKKI